MRIFTAALGLEANTFLPLPTSYQAFVEKLYLPPGKLQERPSHQTAACWVAAERAKRDHFDVIAGPCYAAKTGLHMGTNHF